MAIILSLYNTTNYRINTGKTGSCFKEWLSRYEFSQLKKIKCPGKPGHCVSFMLCSKKSIRSALFYASHGVAMNVPTQQSIVSGVSKASLSLLEGNIRRTAQELKRVTIC